MSTNGNSQRRLSRLCAQRDLGQRIVRLRQQMGWNQKMLAMRLKVTRSRIGKWERGVNAPSLNDLVALTEVLGVTFDELVSGREAPMVPLPPGIRAEFAMCLNRLLRAVKPILASDARDGEGKE